MTGAWVTYTRTNDWDPRVECIHIEEVEARRCAERLIDQRAMAIFLPWGTQFNPDAEVGK